MIVRCGNCLEEMDIAGIGHVCSNPEKPPAFCGWPVNGQPCGKWATPGCAFCDEHALPAKNAIWLPGRWGGQRPTEGKRGLTSEEIVDRGEAARRDRRGVMVAGAIWGGAAGVLVMLLRFHFASPRDFLWGVLIGSLLEGAVIYLSRWSWDRVLWMKWFSR